MNKKIYIITKDKYLGNQRTLGFFMFLNNDLYYDFGLIKGSHDSYHKDGSQWRTSLATGNKAVKEGEHYPLASFQGHLNLGVACFSKRIISKLPKVKKKFFKKYETYEIDLNAFPSDYINIVSELIEPDYIIPLPEEEKCFPPDAVSTTFKTKNTWIIITILGHKHNLLIIPDEKVTHVNHFNERFTANKKGAKMKMENYAGEVFDN